MASKYLRKFRVPEGYKDVLIELIRNVLKGQLAIIICDCKNRSTEGH